MKYLICLTLVTCVGCGAAPQPESPLLAGSAAQAITTQIVPVASSPSIKLVQTQNCTASGTAPNGQSLTISYSFIYTLNTYSDNSKKVECSLITFSQNGVTFDPAQQGALTSVTCNPERLYTVSFLVRSAPYTQIVNPSNCIGTNL